MPEVKNIFVGAKMNKDLNPRLISKNEYIDARNAEVMNSERGDSGLLQNVSGNSIETSFAFDGVELDGVNLEIIGFFIDSTNNRLFAFITDWNDASSDGLSTYAPSTSHHYICMYDVGSGRSTTLVSGSFLNFAKGNSVLGINLLEDLLFFTDDRNQPRKINVNTAIGDTLYYSKEEDISVAKYYPWKPISFLKNKVTPGITPYSLQKNTSLEIKNQVYAQKSNLPFNGEIILTEIGSYGDLEVQGTFTSGWLSNTKVIVKGSGLSEDLEILFSSSDPSVIFYDSPSLETQIQATLIVRDINIEKENTMKDVTSIDLPLTQTLTIVSSNNNSSFVTSNAVNQNWIGSTLYVKSNTLPSDGVTVTNVQSIGSSQYRITHTTATLNLTAEEKVVLGGNPYYNGLFKGDTNFISDRFIRFSYRFKYDDNEYSLDAPFSQIVFIPNQDGYFLEDKVPTNINTEDANSDENNAIKSSIVSFFENKINQVDLSIPMPNGISSSAKLTKDLNVREIEILYKESDKTSIQVLESISTDDLNLGTSNKYVYTYTSQSPVKTLTSKESTRASDKIPIKAKAQEISGNRVIYGNYLVRTARPSTLDYNLISSEKPELGLLNSLSELEFPNSVVKQNRSYKVGIVLVDKFGRQSDVITSNNSTIYTPYETIGGFIDSGTSVYRGESLKLDFLTPIPEDKGYLPGYAGLYSETNPLGWYTYKVVVQQKEQDYYNVYLPTILNFAPQLNVAGGNPLISSSGVAYITLFSDNINKVPRDLKEVGAQDLQYSSSANLYGRVFNTIFAAAAATSKQFLPSPTPDKVVLIGTRDDVGMNKTNDGGDYKVSPFYSIPSTVTTANPPVYNTTNLGANPYIAKVSTQKLIGASGGDVFAPGQPNQSQVDFNRVRLNVYETEAVNSNIDIFYETGTGGLISDLNNEIKTAESSVRPARINGWSWSLSESTTPSSSATPSDFDIVTNEGVSLCDLAAASGSNSVITGEIISIRNRAEPTPWRIEDLGLFELFQGSSNKKFRIKVKANKYFVHTAGSYQINSYIFNFRFTNTVTDSITGVSEKYSIDIQESSDNNLINEQPTVVNKTLSSPEFLEWCYGGFKPGLNGVPEILSPLTFNPVKITYPRYWSSQPFTYAAYIEPAYPSRYEGVGPNGRRVIRMTPRLPDIYKKERNPGWNDLEVFDFENGSASNNPSDKKKGMVVTLEALRFINVFTRSPLYAQDSKWIDLTTDTYTQGWRKQGKYGTTPYTNLSNMFRLQELADGTYNLQFNNDTIVYQQKVGGGAATQYRLFFKVYDSSRDAQGNLAGWGRNRKGFERLSIDVLVGNNKP